MKKYTLFFILFAAMSTLSACDLSLSHQLYNLTSGSESVLSLDKKIFEMNIDYTQVYFFDVNQDKIYILVGSGYTVTSGFKLYTVSTNGTLLDSKTLDNLSTSPNGYSINGNIIHKEFTVNGNFLYLFHYDSFVRYDISNTTVLDTFDNLSEGYVYDNSVIYLVTNSNVVVGYGTDDTFALQTAFTDSTASLYGAYTADLAATADFVYFSRDYTDFDVNECRKYSTAGVYQSLSTNLDRVFDAYDDRLVGAIVTGEYILSAKFELFDTDMNLLSTVAYPSDTVNGFTIDVLSSTFESGGWVYVSAYTSSQMRIYRYKMPAEQ